MADQYPQGLLEGTSDLIGRMGYTLAGGSPGIAELPPAERENAGRRALLNFGLTMLARSGYSAEPRSFANDIFPQAAAAAQMKRAELGLRAEQVGIQRTDAQIKGLELLEKIQQLEGYGSLPAGTTERIRQQILGGKGAPALPAGATPAGAPAGGGEPPKAISAADIDSRVPEVARPFLAQLASLESGGDSQVLYGGGKFTGTDFPSWDGVKLNDGSETHAAGRYQFQPATWQRTARDFKLPDFSPGNQDFGAYLHASRTYSEKTGRSLVTDLQDPSRMPAILGALQDEWPTLKGRTALPAGTQFAGPGAPPGGDGAKPAEDPLRPPDPATVQLPPDEEAEFNRRREQARKAHDVAGIKTVEDERLKALQTLRNATRTERVAYDKEQRERAEKRAEEDRKRAAEIEAARLKQQGELQKDAQLNLLQADKKRIEEFNTAGTQAREMRGNLDQLAALLPSLGSADLLAQRYPLLNSMIMSMGIGTPEERQRMTAQSAFQQIINRTAGALRPVGSGALSDQEMAQYREAFPTLAQSDEGRQITLAFMRQAINRKIAENDFATDYWATSRPSDPTDPSSPKTNTTRGLHKAMDTELGPMVQSAPRPTAKGPNDPRAEEDIRVGREFLTSRKPGEVFTIWRPVQKPGQRARLEPLLAMRKSDGSFIRGDGLPMEPP